MDKKKHQPTHSITHALSYYIKFEFDWRKQRSTEVQVHFFAPRNVFLSFRKYTDQMLKFEWIQ